MPRGIQTNYACGKFYICLNTLNVYISLFVLITLSLLSFIVSVHIFYGFTKHKTSTKVRCNRSANGKTTIKILNVFRCIRIPASAPILFVDTDEERIFNRFCDFIIEKPIIKRHFRCQIALTRCTYDFIGVNIFVMAKNYGVR